MFPPSFILVQLFRRSRPRTTRTQMMKKQLDQVKTDKSEFIDLKKKEEDEKNENKVGNENEKKKKKRKSKLTFPWWFKIIAYVLSFIFASVSAFFIVVKGITFGDEKSLKWLTSLIISVFTSFLLTQPIQV